jgi:Ca2+-dependent lipid-binding protein
MDQETINADRTLGLIEVPASDYISQAENGEYLVHDSKTPHAGALRMHGKGSPRGTLNYTAAFYPCLNIADPEEEEKEQKETEVTGKASSERGRISLDNVKSADGKDAVAAENEKTAASKVDDSLAKKLAEGEREQEETMEEKKLPKIRLTPEELVKYESGLIIFKLLDCEFTRSNVHVEVVIDDMAFPSYSSSTVRSRKTTLDEIGDCFVRELDFSKITLRLREKGESKGDEKKDHTIAKLTGNTLDTLKQCLVSFHLHFPRTNANIDPE